MKMRLTQTLFASCIIWTLFTGLKRDPSNPPTASTGAPNEGTCQQSGCHSGGAYNGTLTMAGVPDVVSPNQTYTITLTNTSSASRSGFQMTCIDGSNVKCGTFTNGTGTSTATSSALNRQYIRQSAAKSLSNGSVSWTFTWTAPATAVDDSVKFYFTSLCANGNGNNSGDNVLTAYKRVKLSTATPTYEITEGAKYVQVFPTVFQNTLTVNLLQTDNGQIQLYDLQGKLVLNKTLDKYNQLSLNDLQNGVYIAQIMTNGVGLSKKLIKQ